MEEARDGVAALAASGIAVKELVVNRVTARPRAQCPVCEARVASEAPIIARAHTLFPGIPVRLLPTLSDEPRGPVLLRQVGRCLRRSSSGPAHRRPPAGRSRHRAILAAREIRCGDDWLSAMAPPGVRLLLFAGKGGVGKTTCAASVALSLADRAPDRHVLLLSTDPAHSLGDVLATPLDDVARSVPGGPPGLRARELDAGALFASRRRRYLDAVDRVFADLRGGSRFDLAFDRAVVEDLVDLAPPGIDELLGLLAITDALMPGASGGAQSMVIVDTAPTGHVLRLLAMPAAGLEWVHALMALLLKYRKVIGLGQLSSDLLEVSRELRQLQAVLGDPRLARLVIVGRAAELSRLETRRLITGVNALRIGISATVINALTPPACARCRRVGERERRTIRAFEKDLQALVSPRCAIIGAPVAMPPPRGAEELGRWRRAWTRLDA
jgi:arsenite-transporting ATPase